MIPSSDSDMYLLIIGWNSNSLNSLFTSHSPSKLWLVVLFIMKIIWSFAKIWLISVIFTSPDNPNSISIYSLPFIWIRLEKYIGSNADEKIWTPFEFI